MAPYLIHDTDSGIAVFVFILAYAANTELWKMAILIRDSDTRSNYFFFKKPHTRHYGLKEL